MTRNDCPPASARYFHKPGVITTDLGAELILLDPATQEMFSLDPVGGMIWGILETTSVEGVVDQVVSSFEVTRATAVADVRALVRQLEDAGLVIPAD